MYKIKNRFSYINMIKEKDIPLEIQETILNHEKTIQDLSNEIDLLKNKNKKYEDEILLLKQKNDIYLNVIKQYDKTKPILERFPIIPINVTKEECMSDPTVKEVLDFIASETNYMIKYQYRIGKYLDEIKKIDIEYIINFKVKKENLSYGEKSKLKKKITRCKYLCDTYRYKLNSISFSVFNISIMTKVEWEEWLNELDKIMQNKYPPGYKCDYIKKAGKNKGLPCGKVDCDEH